MRETTQASQFTVQAVRWSARVLGALLATFFLFFLIADLLGEDSGAISWVDAVALASIFVMVAALVVGWFWEGVAAAGLLAGYTVLVIVDGRLVPAPPFLLFPILGLMFAFCFWRSSKADRGEEAGRRRDDGRPAIRAGALLGLMALVGGLLLLMQVPGPAIAAPPGWTGEWRGEFEVPYSKGWTAGAQPMTLIIRPDGAVEGTIGDAEMVSGQLRQEFWIYRKRRVIEASLEGWVVKEKRIAAESVDLRPRSEEGALRLSFEAHGEEFGYITSNEFPLQRMD